MSLTIDTTISGLTANSYVTVAEVDEYYTGHPYNDLWLAASAIKKSQIVLYTAHLLDTYIVWRGRKSVITQAMEHPRWGLFDKGGWPIRFDLIAPEVKEAQSELCRFALRRDYQSDELSGIDFIVTPSVRLRLNPSMQFTSIPDAVSAIVSHLGGSRSGRATQVRTLRV